MKFICPLIVVEDIARARRFYEQTLGQTVKIDFGENVTFAGDFAIHLRSHFQGLLGDPECHPISQRSHNFELYFETDEVAALNDRLKQENVEFVHEVREQPWGQRVLRIYDPDGHIVEIGETMEAVVRRFSDQGLSIEEIAAKTFMPREFIEMALKTAGAVL